MPLIITPYYIYAMASEAATLRHAIFDYFVAIAWSLTPPFMRYASAAIDPLFFMVI